MLTKRLKICIATGAILGVFCIVGAFLRSGFQRDSYFLLALWYNRLMMGLVIGLAVGNLGWPKLIGRGAFFGLVVSLAFYLSTGFIDVVSFLAGIIYGIIIEYIAFKYNVD